MLKTWSRLLQAIESHLALVQMAAAWAARLIGGLAMVWLTWLTDTMSTYAPLSYGVAFLLGAVAISLVLALTGLFRVQLARARIFNKFERNPGSVNPLENNFSKQRIELNKIASPIGNEIAEKTFIDCELVGPLNIYLQKGNAFINMQIINCNFVVTRRGVNLYNMAELRDCTFTRCTLYGITFFVHPDVVPHMPPGVQWVTAHPDTVENTKGEALSIQVSQDT